MFRGYLRVLDRGRNGMSASYASLGRKVGKHPFVVISVSLFIASLMTVGYFYRTEESRSDKLWIPQDNRSTKTRDYVEDHYETPPRRELLIVTAADSKSVLRRRVLLEVCEMHERIASETTSWKGRTLSLSGICIRRGASCFISSILETWNYDCSTISGKTDADLLADVRSNDPVTVEFNSPYDTILGAIERDSGGNIVSAEALQLTYYVSNEGLNSDNENPEKQEWERNVFLDVAESYEDGSFITVYRNAETSINDEFGKTIRGDLGLLAFGFIGMLVFVMATLAKRDWVKSWATVGIMGVGVVLVSLMSSQGVVAWFVFMTPMNNVIAFILLAIGVDDVLVIVNAYLLLPVVMTRPRKRSVLLPFSDESGADLETGTDEPLEGKELVAEKMAACLRVSGVAITITSVTNITAFFLGALSSLPAIRSFCIYTGTAIAVDFVFQVTLFVALFVLNARREQSSRFDVFCCITRRKEVNTNNKQNDVNDDEKCETMSPPSITVPCDSKQCVEVADESIESEGTESCDAQKTQLGDVEVKEGCETVRPSHGDDAVMPIEVCKTGGGDSKEPDGLSVESDEDVEAKEEDINDVTNGEIETVSDACGPLSCDGKNVDAETEQTDSHVSDFRRKEDSHFDEADCESGDVEEMETPSDSIIDETITKAVADCSGEVQMGQNETVIRKIIRHVAVPVLRNRWVKIFVLIAFVSYLALSIYWITLLKQDFDRRDFAPDDSYLVPFIDHEDEYFSNRGPRFNIIWKTFDLADPSNLRKMVSLENVVSRMRYVSYEVPEDKTSWLTDETNGFLSFNKENHTDLCDADGIPHDRAQVYTFLGEWWSSISIFHSDIVTIAGKDVQPSSSNLVISSRITFSYVAMDDAEMSVNALEKTYSTFEEWEDENDLPVSPWSFSFLFWEQFRVIVREGAISVGLALVAVFVVTLLMLVDPRASLLCLLMVAMIDVDLIGSMYLWNLTINAVTVVMIVISTGLSVDSSVHIAHSFMHQNCGTKQMRSGQALIDLGPSTLGGLLTTLIGVFPLAFAGSLIFKTFFKMFLSIIIFSFCHSLILLPVLLSLIGPPSLESQLKKQEKGKETNGRGENV
eukprot:TRINITY_DN81583_c0_g1_i1.p1 TRINITY_DN81583_c0_g1~~TRINITY_DN81583_c0_g1_i1.p1  ORF type:complete len:1094 (-),score=238.21 TRINITY_DN81583_c0_g1_i1:78-3359(-)